MAGFAAITAKVNVAARELSHPKRLEDLIVILSFSPV
jgi:hypothetical protein